MSMYCAFPVMFGWVADPDSCCAALCTELRLVLQLLLISLSCLRCRPPIADKMCTAQHTSLHLVYISFSVAVRQFEVLPACAPTGPTVRNSLFWDQRSVL